LLFLLLAKKEVSFLLNFSIKPNIYGSIVSRILKIKVVNNITGLGSTFIRQNKINAFYGLMYKVSLKKAKHIFFQNQEDHELFLRNRIISINQSVSLIPGSGVDTSKFSPEKKSQKKDFVFLMVSRILKDKGILEFIEACKEVSQKHTKCKFWIVGQYDLKNQNSIPYNDFIDLIKSNSIRYKGTLDTIEELLQKVSCVVLPSYREGSPRSLMEASSMELPVIATDVVGCKSVVEDNVTGFLCKVRDYKDLSDKMKKMYKLAPEERKKMGKKGRNKMIREFSEEIIFDNYIHVLKSK